MKTRNLIIIPFLFLLVHSCKKDNSDDNKDSVVITSVTPSSGLVDGQLTDFKVEGSYNLLSHDSATIMIGFNNENSIREFNMYSEKDSTILKGKGQFSFDVKAKVKDWGTEGTFSVYVNISPNPVPDVVWFPYCSKIYPLVQKK